MRTLFALINREYLEHRGAFLYAPLGILVVLAFSMISALGLGRFTAFQQTAAMVPASKGFELAFLVLGALWFVYLLAALFFYFADAFSADRRNNAMLFWKSMPVSDFTVLFSKMMAGMTIFPLMVLGAMLASGLIIIVGLLVSTVTAPGVFAVELANVIGSVVNVGIFAVGFLVLALLWYAPFFAWVGALSTVFRRWSIPLAFLIPGLLGLMENIFFPDRGPRAGFILSYLRDRASMDINLELLVGRVSTAQPINSLAALGDVVGLLDWPQLAGGLIVAALLVLAASEYRRRRLDV